MQAFIAQREQDLTGDPARREPMVLTQATGLFPSAGGVTAASTALLKTAPLSVALVRRDFTVHRETHLHSLF